MWKSHSTPQRTSILPGVDGIEKDSVNDSVEKDSMNNGIEKDSVNDSVGTRDVSPPRRHRENSVNDSEKDSVNGDTSTLPAVAPSRLCDHAHGAPAPRLASGS